MGVLVTHEVTSTVEIVVQKYTTMLSKFVFFIVSSSLPF